MRQQELGRCFWFSHSFMKTLSLLKFKSSPLRGVPETQKERMIVFQLSLFRGELLSFSRKYCLPYTGFGQLFLRHQKHLPTFRQNHAPPKKWRKKHGVQFFVGTFWICFGYVLRTPKHLKRSKNTHGAKSPAVSDRRWYPEPKPSRFQDPGGDVPSFRAVVFWEPQKVSSVP